MTLESLKELPLAEKMRLAANGGFDGADGNVVNNMAKLIGSDYRDATTVFKAMADEIDERYMELPVDSEGIPIHIGDEMDGRSLANPVTVIGIAKNSFFHSRSGGFIWTFHASDDYVHVKPRTLEDVLADYHISIGAIENAYDSNTDEYDRLIGETNERFAAEIRELLKEGA